MDRCTAAFGRAVHSIDPTDFDKGHCDKPKASNLRSKAEQSVWMPLNDETLGTCKCGERADLRVIFGAGIDHALTSLQQLQVHDRRRVQWDRRLAEEDEMLVERLSQGCPEQQSHRLYLRMRAPRHLQLGASQLRSCSTKADCTQVRSDGSRLPPGDASVGSDRCTSESQYKVCIPNTTDAGWTYGHGQAFNCIKPCFHCIEASSNPPA